MLIHMHMPSGKSIYEAYDVRSEVRSDPCSETYDGSADQWPQCASYRLLKLTYVWNTAGFRQTITEALDVGHALQASTCQKRLKGYLMHIVATRGRGEL